jgi:predicted DNA-binding transcriptional regulator AlpA
MEVNMTAHAMTVDEFCQSHRISRGTFYNLLKSDQGPAVMKVGSRTLVSEEAAAEWRRHVEGASAKRVAA